MSKVQVVYANFSRAADTGRIHGPADEPAEMAYHIQNRHCIMGIGSPLYHAACKLMTDAPADQRRINSAKAAMNRRTAEWFAPLLRAAE